MYFLVNLEMVHCYVSLPEGSWKWDDFCFFLDLPRFPLIPLGFQEFPKPPGETHLRCQVKQHLFTALVGETQMGMEWKRWRFSSFCRKKMAGYTPEV